MGTGYLRAFSSLFLSCLILLCPAPPLLAQDSPPTQEAEASAPSLLEAARVLFSEARFDEARQFLLAATPTSEQEAIEQRFLLAMIALETGAPREAAEGFESILSEHPDLLRVRLELARAYYLTGDDEKARHHFSYVLGAEHLPRGVENSVDAFLNRIEARKNWSADFAVAVLPQSNVTQSTDSETVRIGPFLLRLNEDARRRSGIGLQVNGGLAWQPTIQGDWRGRAALSTRVRRYKNKEWNDVILAGDLGVLRLFDGGSLGAGPRLQRRWLGNQEYLWRRGVWGSWQQQFLRRNRLDLNVEVVQLDYDNRDAANGWSFLVAPDISRGISSRSRIRLDADLQMTFAREDDESSYLLGIGGGITHGFAGGLVAALDVGAHVQRRRGKHPLFGEVRQDLYGFTRIRLLHREIRFQGFAPYIEYRYERSHANIDFFSYDNHVGNIGVTRQF